MRRGQELHMPMLQPVNLEQSAETNSTDPT